MQKLLIRGTSTPRMYLGTVHMILDDKDQRSTDWSCKSTAPRWLDGMMAKLRVDPSLPDGPGPVTKGEQRTSRRANGEPERFIAAFASSVRVARGRQGGGSQLARLGCADNSVWVVAWVWVGAAARTRVVATVEPANELRLKGG
jgi:hypothetical protein